MESERLESQPEVFVRTLRREDGQKLARIDAAITGRSRATWFEKRLQRALAETDVYICLGAEKDGNLVGGLLGSVQMGEFGIVDAVAVLDTVLVDPKLKGGGVASAMLEQLLVNLRGLRVSKVRTEVAWNELELVAFFNRKGFAPVSRLVLERAVEGEGR